MPGPTTTVMTDPTTDTEEATMEITKDEATGETLFFDGHPTRVGWGAIRADVDRYLAANADVLGAFRDRLTGLFVAMRDALVKEDKEPFRRRPNVSLRLIVAGEPAAKLIALPHVRHDRTGGYLIPWGHTIELMERRPLKLVHEGREADTVQFLKKLDFQDTGPRAFRAGSLYRSAADDARRLVETIREFLGDARAVLSRGCDHCCICGRPLTDELSRSRGIGPECIRKADIVAVLLGDGQLAGTFVAPEPVDA
jgi:hypothetical protein